MKIGIAGLPKSGKTTLMKLLTQTRGDAPVKSNTQAVGVMEVPDPRIDWLSSLYSPQRTIYARSEVFDIQPHKGQEFLNSARNLDALIVVIPSFTDPAGGPAFSVVDDLETEFFVSDLSSVETRLERLSGHKAKPVSAAELPFLEKCRKALDDGIPLRKVEFESHEKDFLSNFAFFTMLPLILAVNVSEGDLAARDYPGREVLETKAAQAEYPVVVFSGEVEPEISALPEAERLEFLKEYGLQETGVSRIARASYGCLGLISFFTVGEDEVRAWTITRGMNARQAAGKIHTDLEKGFIRAEVVAYDDLHSNGSMKACKDKGLLRVEGKEYIVKDGDILNIRFNV